MKKLQSLLAIALCGAIFSAVVAQANQQGYGTVVRAVGEASYTLGDNQWHPLQAGKYLPVGATVRTGHNGIVDIVLGKDVAMPQAAWQPNRISPAPDSPVRGMISYKPTAEQNVIRLTHDTTISIDKLTITDTGADTVSDTELDLKQGKIFASVKKLTGASQYLIKLPNGIAGVRGTEFSISVDGTIQCLKSESGGGVLLSQVEATDSNAHTYSVPPGQGFTPGSGTAPLSADVMSTLGSTFTAMCTTYNQVCNFSFDNTQCFVSPRQGNQGNQGNQGGNGQGNQGGNGQ